MAALGALVAPVACASSSASSPAPAAPPVEENLEIRTTSGAPLEAVAGDALALEVVDVHPDGSTERLPAAASVTFTAPAAITALAPDNTGPNPLPVVGTRAGTAPSAAWLANPSRLDTKNVLFILERRRHAAGWCDYPCE